VTAACGRKVQLSDISVDERVGEGVGVGCFRGKSAPPTIFKQSPDLSFLGSF